jgi:hypothetical protein
MTENSASRIAWPVRIGLLTTGLIVPLVSLRVAHEVSAPAWQSGQMSAYASLILANEAIYFSPFLAYAIGSFVFVLFAPDRAARHFAVRFGVYTGLLLCLQFILLALATLQDGNGNTRNQVLLALACGLGGTIVPLGSGWGAIKIVRRWGTSWIWSLLGVLGLAFALIVVFAKSPLEIVYVAVGAPVIVALIAAPFWSLASYLGISVFVYRRCGGRPQYRLSDVMCLLTWLGAYLGTLRISVTQAIEQYAQLPPTPTRNCYVCSAAAHGHPALVGSRLHKSPEGTMVAVNQQMRRLKAAELAVAVAAPGWHSAIRSIYDLIGPPLARLFSNRFVADLAYLLLKPAEWLACAALRALLQNFDDLASRLYSLAPHDGGSDQ